MAFKFPGVGSSVSVGEIEGATLVTAAETIAANDNDTTIPTSAATKAYADGVGGGISNIVEDVTPQLGANLDLNTFGIGDAGDLTKEITFDVSGATTASTATIVSSHTTDRTITLPDATATLATTAETAMSSLGTVSTGLTGVLRADSGVLSADTDVTDLVDNLAVSALADGTDGELITWDAAGAPATVAAGTSTHVLTSNGAGAAPTFQAATAATTEVGDAWDQGFSEGWLINPFDLSADSNAEMTESLASTGSADYTPFQIRLIGATSSGAGATIEGPGLSWNREGSMAQAWDLDFVLEGNFSLSDAATQDVFFGIGGGCVGSGLVVADATETSRHVGFFVQDATLYASNADNTTQTTDDISAGITLTNFNTYRIEYNAGVNILFYVNGTLESTSSTNLPSGSSTAFTPAYGITARGTNDPAMYLSRFAFFAIKAGQTW